MGGGHLDGTKTLVAEESVEPTPVPSLTSVVMIYECVMLRLSGSFVNWS